MAMKLETCCECGFSEIYQKDGEYVVGCRKYFTIVSRSQPVEGCPSFIPKGIVFHEVLGDVKSSAISVKNIAKLIITDIDRMLIIAGDKYLAVDNGVILSDTEFEAADRIFGYVKDSAKRLAIEMETMDHYLNAVEGVLIKMPEEGNPGQV